MSKHTQSDVVILAAGEGTRMRSSEPKVLRLLGGKPMLGHVFATASALPGIRLHVVLPPGSGGQAIRGQFADSEVNWVEQPEPLGTGHAVHLALGSLHPDGVALILYGDVPLVQRETLERLTEQAAQSGFALLATNLAEPFGYGRILRDASGAVEAIVEEADATPEQRAVKEVSTGVMAVSVTNLSRWLPYLATDNAQGEIYLTDLVMLARRKGCPVSVCAVSSPEEALGANDPAQLAVLERALQKRLAQQWMQRGVTIADPARFDLRGEMEAGEDVFIDINVLLEGRVRIGSRVRIGPNCVLRDADLGDDVTVQANSVVEEATIGANAVVGPFARLRPGTTLAPGVQVGNFVEIKNTYVGAESKINHLSYVGDAELGKKSNIGAGTITCNYDGKSKHKTIIGDRVFIGSNTSLVAPVEVGDDATVGAGSTITESVPEKTLGVGRSKQRNIPNWRQSRDRR